MQLEVSQGTKDASETGDSSAAVTAVMHGCKFVEYFVRYICIVNQ